MYQTLIQTFQTDWVEYSTKSSLAMQNYCSIDYPVFYHPSYESVLSQLSTLTIIYFILGVKSCSPIFLVEMSANYRPPSHQSILCIFHFYPFLTKCILLAMCLVSLVSLPLLTIHISDLLSNTIREDSSGTMPGSLFKNSWINILKYAKAISIVHVTLYLLYALDWATGTGTCVPWSIGPPW